MTKDELKALGLTDVQIEKIVDDQSKNWIVKSRFNEVNEAKKTLEASVAERDKQLTELKKASGKDAELQKQIEELQKANKSKDAEYQSKIQTMTIDNIVTTALMGAKAKDVKAVRALLKMDKYELDGSDNVKGLKEAIEAAKKENAWAFNEEKPSSTAPNMKGFAPAPAGDGANGQAGGAPTVASTFENALKGVF